MFNPDVRVLIDFYNQNRWGGVDFVTWLRNGLKSLRENDQDQLAQHFPPLYCDNTRDVMTQVVQTLDVARDLLPPCFAAEIETGLKHALHTMSFVDEDSLRDAAILWSFQGALGFPVLFNQEARQSMKRISRLSAKNKDRQSIKDLADAIVMVMARVDVDVKSSLQFYKDLRDPLNAEMGNGKFWDAKFFPCVMDKSLKDTDAQARLVVWERLKADYPREIAAHFSASTGWGRAMINSCARQISGVSSEREMAAWPPSPQERQQVLMRPNGAAAYVPCG